MNSASVVRAGFIGALYASLTYALAPISYGPLQFRLSEALTVLPILFSEAVIGLFVGTMIANILGGLGLWDIFGSSLVTLIAAWDNLFVSRPANCLFVANHPQCFVSEYLSINIV